MASHNISYVTCVADLGMLAFTELWSYGYERMCRSLNFPASCYSRNANGEDLKFDIGGLLNGPVILLMASSCSILVLMTLGCDVADVEL